jgi:hypothetical protein
MALAFNVNTEKGLILSVVDTGGKFTADVNGVNARGLGEADS